jgi:hypothetical protein
MIFLSLSLFSSTRYISSIFDAASVFASVISSAFKDEAEDMSSSCLISSVLMLDSFSAFLTTIFFYFLAGIL